MSDVCATSIYRKTVVICSHLGSDEEPGIFAATVRRLSDIQAGSQSLAGILEVVLCVCLNLIARWSICRCLRCKPSRSMFVITHEET